MATTMTMGMRTAMDMVTTIASMVTTIAPWDEQGGSQFCRSPRDGGPRAPFRKPDRSNMERLGGRATCGAKRQQHSICAPQRRYPSG